MVDSISRSYATALMDLLNENNMDIRNGLNELEEAKQIIDDELITKYLVHPSIRLDEKTSLIKSNFKQFNSIIVSFLQVLVVNKRINLLADIIDAYQEKLDEIDGIIRIEIVSSDKIKDDLYNKLLKTLETKYQKKVIAKLSIDSSVMGGLIIKQNGYVLDDTLLNKLKAIKDNI